ncbi:MAG: hypothetical protein H0T49_06860, partial [Chloroflexia bacterium]|nr:hypothetical protein [Chloroflexia bacterium]
MKLLGHALCRTAIGFGLTLCAVVSLTFGLHSIGHVRARQVAPAVEKFAVIGTHDLGARGLNAGLALAGACAYVGSRGEGSVAILDISDPAAPDIIGQIAPVAGSTTRELRVDPELALLAILTFRLDPFSAAPNRIDLYDITACAHPRLAGQIDFGESLPHEFIFWRDPDSTHAGRLLTYVAMWGYTPNLRVFDLTDPARPVALAQWDAGAVTGAVSMLHSLSVSPDGTRAYAADWLLGIMALDTSAVARNEVTPGINLLTPPESWVVLPGGNHHSAVPIPGSSGLVTTQEIYGFGTCP